jgi:hypothetical protein
MTIDINRFAKSDMGNSKRDRDAASSGRGAEASEQEMDPLEQLMLSEHQV